MDEKFPPMTHLDCSLFIEITRWIKERYRSMCGYKVPANALLVSRLLA
jgi:hypothetical protein